VNEIVPADFLRDIAGLRRILTATSPEDRVAVFESQAREFVRWITVGGMAKGTVVDDLHFVGTEFGLGVEETQSALESALDAPLEFSLKQKVSRSEEQTHQSVDSGKKITQRDKLVMVSDRATFWRCLDSVAHASVQVGGRTEHHRVRSEGFRSWLIREGGATFPQVIAGKERYGTFSRGAVEEALTFCEAAATGTDQVHPARIRVAEDAEATILDLGDASWRAVEIKAGAWRIVDRATVPILRTRRTRSLASPVHGGSLDPLRELLPAQGEDEYRLVLLWLLAALRGSGPYPILALSGEAGSGKSFTAKLLRELVDPCGDNIMQPPRNDRDLIAAAKGNHVLAFDNLSVMPGDLADSICRLATGGDIGGRMLYTDADTAAFSAQRPIIINGIPDLVTRGDLASRALFIRLAPMQYRRTETQLRSEFSKFAPEILGGLLDALAGALARLPNLTLPDESATLRMADFAQLAMAADTPLGWLSGTGLCLLRANAGLATAVVVEADPIAVSINAFIERCGPYDGLVSTLYTHLCEATDLEIRRGPAWPKDAARFGEHLRRIAPALRENGMLFDERRGSAGMRVTLSLPK
jgi:hypothetical protein